MDFAFDEVVAETYVCLINAARNDGKTNEKRNNEKATIKMLCVMDNIAGGLYNESCSSAREVQLLFVIRNGNGKSRNTTSRLAFGGLLAGSQRLRYLK